MKQILTCIALVVTVSCSDNNNRVSLDSSTDSLSTGMPKSQVDSITNVEIYCFPSFTNSSVLRLNRMTGEGIFTVDTAIGFNYSRPDTLRFPLTDMESKTDIELLWTSSYIHSLRQDTSMLGWTDGMPVFIMFTNNSVKDSVYLGNVYPKSVDSFLYRQIDYLMRKSDVLPMKAYLKQVKGYL